MNPISWCKRQYRLLREAWEAVYGPVDPTPITIEQTKAATVCSCPAPCDQDAAVEPKTERNVKMAKKGQKKTKVIPKKKGKKPC